MTQDLYAKGLDQLAAYFGEPLYHVSYQTEEVAGLRIRDRTSENGSFMLTSDGPELTSNFEFQGHDTDFVCLVTPTTTWLVPVKVVIATAIADRVLWLKEDAAHRPTALWRLPLDGSGTSHDYAAQFTAAGYAIP